MTFYDILEVSPKASKEVIEKAYRVLVKKYHPDLQPADNKAWAEEMIKKLNQAYEIVMNEEKRARYDSENGISLPSTKGDKTDKFDMTGDKNKDVMVQAFINWFRNQ